MIVGIGVDVCDVARFQAALRRHPGLVNKLFDDVERIRDGQQRTYASLAVRFAAKEALAKALGAPGGLAWHDCSVVTGEDGRPSFQVTGSVAAAAARLGVGCIHLSLSHDGGLASAFVICER